MLFRCEARPDYMIVSVRCAYTARFSEVRRRSVANYYILNLAVADGLFVLTLPFLCVATYTADWVFGGAACRLTYAIRETIKYASLLTLVALSVDRCLATYQRLAHLRSIAIGIGVCVVVWTASLVCAGTPYAVYSLVVERAGRRSCKVRWPWEGQLAAQRAWTYGHLLIGVVVPLIVIAVANAVLVSRLRSFAGYTTRRPIQQGPKRTPSTTASQAAGPSGRSNRTSSHPGGPSSRHGDCDSSARRQRASQNMARLVLAIVVIFVVCQLPYHIMEVLNVWCHSILVGNTCIPEILTKSCT